MEEDFNDREDGNPEHHIPVTSGKDHEKDSVEQRLRMFDSEKERENRWEADREHKKEEEKSISHYVSNLMYALGDLVKATAEVEQRQRDTERYLFGMLLE